MDNENILIKAIGNRNLVNFYYDGEEIRRTAPHTIYLSSASKVNLDAFQYDGFSKTGNLPAWRNFTLDKMKELSILAEKFKIADGYNTYSDKYNNHIYKI